MRKIVAQPFKTKTLRIKDKGDETINCNCMIGEGDPKPKDVTKISVNESGKLIFFRLSKLECGGGGKKNFLAGKTCPSLPPIGLKQKVNYFWRER